MGKFKGKESGKSKAPRASAFARAAAASAPAEPRGDEFDPGEYRVRLKDVHESDNGSFGFTFLGAGDDEEIGERIQWFSTKGKSAHVSGPRIKSLCMALLGLAASDVDEYNEFDPNGEFVDTILRCELDAAAEYMAEHGVAKSAKAARKVLDDAEVLIKVSKGGEKDDGGFFRNASFRPVEDGEDSEDDSDDSADEDEAPAPKRKAAPAKGKASKRAPVEEEDDEDEDDDSDDEEEDEEDDEPESEPAPKRKAKTSKRK